MKHCLNTSSNGLPQKTDEHRERSASEQKAVLELQPVVPEERIPDDSGNRRYGLKYGWAVKSHFIQVLDGECSVRGLAAKHVLRTVGACPFQFALRPLPVPKQIIPPTPLRQETVSLVRMVANDAFWVSSHKLFFHHIASDSLHVSLLPLPTQRFFVYVRTLYGQTSVASRFMFVQCTFSGRCCLVLLVLAPRWFRKSTSRHLLYLLVDLCQGLFAAWWQQPCWLQFEVNLNNLCLGNLLLLKAFRWPLANYKDVMRPERKRCSWSSERKA